MISPLSQLVVLIKPFHWPMKGLDCLIVSSEMETSLAGDLVSGIFFKFLFGKTSCRQSNIDALHSQCENPISATGFE